MTDKRTEIAEILAGHAGSKAFLSDGSEFGHIREVWFGYADALIKHLPELAESAPDVVHVMGGEGVTRCCWRSPFELPRSDRITMDSESGTCAPSVRMPLAWPISTHNPQNGEEWPLCIRHKGAPVIGGVCGRCTMRGGDW